MPKKRKTTKRKPKTANKKLKDECDALWAECIKLRAGYKSEYSGKPGKQIGGDSILNAHHLIGKSSLGLRYNFDNGICLTNGEHNFIAHHTQRAEGFREFVKSLRGEDIFEKLTKFKHKTSTSLRMYKIYLEQEIKKIKEK